MLNITQYKLRKDIPVPTRRKVARGKWMSLAATMSNYGDCYFVEKTKVNSLIAAMKKLGFEYRSEAAIQDGVVGRLVWRTDRKSENEQ